MNKTQSSKRVEGKNKDQSRNKLNNIKKKNNIKYQWNQDLVLWEDKQDWQTFHQTHQEKMREDSNK